MVSNLEKKIVPKGTNSIFYELNCIVKGGKSENDRVASPENMHTYLHLAQSIYQLKGRVEGKVINDKQC